MGSCLKRAGGEGVVHRKYDTGGEVSVKVRVHLWLDARTTSYTTSQAKHAHTHKHVFKTFRVVERGRICLYVECEGSFIWAVSVWAFKCRSCVRILSLRNNAVCLLAVCLSLEGKYIKQKNRKCNLNRIETQNKTTLKFWQNNTISPTTRSKRGGKLTRNMLDIIWTHEQDE